jgi:hypothetical protein
MSRAGLLMAATISGNAAWWSLTTPLQRLRRSLVTSHKAAFRHYFSGERSPGMNPYSLESIWTTSASADGRVPVGVVLTGSSHVPSNRFDQEIVTAASAAKHRLTRAPRPKGR